MHLVDVLVGVDALGFDVDSSFWLDGRICGAVRGGKRIRPCEFPPAAEGVFHDCDGDGATATAARVRVHIFRADMVHDVGGFRGGEQRDACAVTEEAQVPEVSHDVHGHVPGDLRGR